MNQSYWAEKQKNQTQMLRVIHDQMHELHEDIYKVARTLGKVSSNLGVAADAFKKLHKELRGVIPSWDERNKFDSKRIDLLSERIEVLTTAVIQWAPITVKQKKEWEKTTKPKKKKEKK